jgi:hypothetical protein
MNFEEIVEKICDRSPLQRNLLTGYLATCDSGFFKEADEFVERYQVFLERLKTLLIPEGKAFISTCANCPTIDHVYQFDTVEQMRDLITSSGLRIVRDFPLPVEDMTVEEAEAGRITINYCALLEG